MKGLDLILLSTWLIINVLSVHLLKFRFLGFKIRSLYCICVSSRFDFSITCWFDQSARVFLLARGMTLIVFTFPEHINHCLTALSELHVTSLSSATSCHYIIYYIDIEYRYVRFIASYSSKSTISQ